MSDDRPSFGYTEGEVCWRNGCQGIIAEHAVEGCSCHISPPCSACTAPREYCPECDWEAKDEEREQEARSTFYCDVDTGVWWQEKHTPKPLDPRKIDYRITSHSNSSQLVTGVYPEGTSRSEVEARVKGTFGGQFNHFENGKFEYVAYTD